MERFKQILHKLLFPGAAVTALSIPVSAALLIYTFAFAHENEPAADPSLQKTDLVSAPPATVFRFQRSSCFWGRIGL